MKAAGPTRGKPWQGLLAAALVALAVASAETRATVLLDTFAPSNGTPGPNYHLNNGGVNGHGNGQSLAVPFSTGAAVTVNSILAAISGSGSVTIGIMANAGGVPSNVYLHSTLLTNPAANVLLSGLGWALAAGDYWLAAIGVDPFDGHWRGGDENTDFAFTREADPVTAWIHFTTDLPDFEVPAARIATGITAVPEPAAWVLFATALLLAGLGGRRRAAPARPDNP